MKKIMLFAFLTMGFYAGQAQEVPGQLDTKSKTKVKSSSSPSEHPISIQVHGGSQGFGLDARYGLTPRVSFRLGGSALGATRDNLFDFSGFESDNTIKGKLGNVHLMADLSPFKSSVFKFVVGAGYLFNANGDLTFKPTGNYNFGGLNLTAEEVGQLNVDFSWKGLAPYAGIGLFKSFPKRTFNVNLDLGTYFLKSPESTVVGTKLLADNQALAAQFDSNMKDYKFLPVIQLNFNFRIK